MENYEVICQIGKGSFGVVQKIKRKSDGKILVWKEMNYGRMAEREKQQLVSEVNIIRELRHPNIVRYYDRIIDKKCTKIFLIMEYCEGGDMGTLLKKSKRENDFIAEDAIWKIFGQIMFALNECHNRPAGKILHRDLKPANIFFDAQNNIKLGDFGLSREMGENSVFATTNVGTPYYMSPEQISEAKYNEKSDIWSAGCLLYEMAALKPPFQALNQLSLAIKIKEGKFDRLPQRYSEELQTLVESMLQTNPEKRPSVEELIELPVIKLRLREKKFRDKLASVKTKEDELKEREAALNRRVEMLNEREKCSEDQQMLASRIEQEIMELEAKLARVKRENEERMTLQKLKYEENKLNNYNNNNSKGAPSLKSCTSSTATAASTGDFFGKLRCQLTNISVGKSRDWTTSINACNQSKNEDDPTNQKQQTISCVLSQGSPSNSLLSQSPETVRKTTVGTSRFNLQQQYLQQVRSKESMSTATSELKSIDNFTSTTSNTDSANSVKMNSYKSKQPLGGRTATNLVKQFNGGSHVTNDQTIKKECSTSSTNGMSAFERYKATILSNKSAQLLQQQQQQQQSSSSLQVQQHNTSVANRIRNEEEQAQNTGRMNTSSDVRLSRESRLRSQISIDAASGRIVTGENHSSRIGSNFQAENMKRSDSFKENTSCQQQSVELEYQTAGQVNQHHQYQSVLLRKKSSIGTNSKGNLVTATTTGRSTYSNSGTDSGQVSSRLHTENNRDNRQLSNKHSYNSTKQSTTKQPQLASGGNHSSSNYFQAAEQQLNSKYAGRKLIDDNYGTNQTVQVLSQQTSRSQQQQQYGQGRLHF